MIATVWLFTLYIIIQLLLFQIHERNVVTNVTGWNIPVRVYSFTVLTNATCAPAGGALFVCLLSKCTMLLFLGIVLVIKFLWANNRCDMNDFSENTWDNHWTERDEICHTLIPLPIFFTIKSLYKPIPRSGWCRYSLSYIQLYTYTDWNS